MVRRTPDGSWTRGGEQSLQPEIHRVKGSSVAGVRGCSVELCYPLPACPWQCPAAGSGASPGPGHPVSLQPLASAQLGGMREADPCITFPRLPALPSPGTVSVCLSVRSQDSVQRVLTCRRHKPCAPGRRCQGDWELLRLHPDFALGWPGHQAWRQQ